MKQQRKIPCGSLEYSKPCNLNETIGALSGRLFSLPSDYRQTAIIEFRRHSDYSIIAAEISYSRIETDEEEQEREEQKEEASRQRSLEDVIARMGAEEKKKLFDLLLKEVLPKPGSVKNQRIKEQLRSE